MNAEIISIGTELLLGHILNTNTAFLSHKLAELGIDVYNTSVVGDNPQRMIEALAQALERSDIVITTGGLGPTVDDITIETIARFIAKPLVMNKTVLKDLEDYFKLRNMKLPSATIRQAYIPKGVKWIRNMVGTAPGLLIDWKEKQIICLPGPPRELNPMFINNVLPIIKKMSKSTWIIKCRTIKITGLPESVINKTIKGLLELKPPTTVGIYAKLGEVDLKIMAKAKNERSASAAIQIIEKKICTGSLKNFIFGYDDDTLEATVGKILTQKKQTIAIAESCTGGLLSNRLTDISGSSKYFIVGLVAYSNSIKKNILGISKESLRKDGAVSQKVALEMALGIRLLASTNIGIGITGIAGPTHDATSKPVGLVYIAIATGAERIVKEFQFKGSRKEIKFQASQAALDLIRNSL